ncbi:hypothetical protein M947_04570 [Sulfurimonas hongkongensis]|uniref:Uncharacterized protein n=1 Tax=Sulfurimonas hongkongensis TaxID=1172190 RepID=T0JSC1_9BACT|nr:hypothetical protein [Sulfurimonas hongkongensis]EQB39857.1 hypothetical protein M947_04570 [Sulfurimonas hongkongensis]
MLGKLFESIYSKIFVAIVIERSKSVVYIHISSRKHTPKNYHKSFDSTEFGEKIKEYIDSFIGESPFSYICVLDYSEEQGAIPTCSTKDMSTFGDFSASKMMCHKNGWAYYTSASDIETIKKTYAQVGVDFIFSSFSVLSSFFKDKIDSHLGLFVLVENSYITLGVFDNCKLLFAEHLNIEHDNNQDELMMDSSDEEIDLDLGSSIDLDDIDAMSDIDGLDDFGDIEDLDTIDEIDEFAQSQDDEFLDEEEELLVQDPSSFNEDYQRFLAIQSSVNRFYKDSKYQSKFIETVYIADAVGVSSDLKTYLEEEMFFSVFVRHIDLGSEIIDLAKAELK